MKLPFFSLVVVLLLDRCNIQQEYIYEPEFKPSKTYSIIMPIYEGSFSYPRIINVVDSNIIVYYYGKDSLFVYNSYTTQFKYGIPIEYSSLHGLEFINNDSIWLFGEIKKSHTRSFTLIDITGKVKKTINISNKYGLKDFVQIFENRFWYDNKLFFTLYYYNEDGINQNYKQHPIVGYYDIIKDSLFLNYKIYFPYLKDGIFYPHKDYLMRYCPFFTINDKDELIISFTYTSTFYVWNLKTNNIQTFHSAKSCLYDTIIPFHRPINRFDPEFISYSKKIGYYDGIKYFEGQKIYSRFILLPENEYGYSNGVYIFLDSQKKYIGEIKAGDFCVDSNKIFLQENKNDSLLLAYSYKKNRLNIYRGNIIFKKIYKNEYINKMKYQAEISKRTEQNEVCRIFANKENINKQDILIYLRNKHNILDSSFTAIIINTNGCPGCNNYILNNFLKINKSIFFSINKTPFYLVYIDKNGNLLNIKDNVLNEFLNYENKLKIDTSGIYEKVNLSNSYNPRLILVKNNKIINDSIYSPDNMSGLAISLINFYGFEAEEK